jgi:hypothetical protein
VLWVKFGRSATRVDFASHESLGSEYLQLPEQNGIAK